jgi:hypothetical protein
MEHPETVELFNMTPGGAKCDLFFLKKVPNPDYSGWEYLTDYQQYEFMNSFEVGRCDMIRGQLLFTVTNPDLQAHGLPCTALLLIGKWLEENQIPVEDL